jgi:hypothetical protein
MPVYNYDFFSYLHLIWFNARFTIYIMNRRRRSKVCEGFVKRKGALIREMIGELYEVTLG